MDRHTPSQSPYKSHKLATKTYSSNLIDEGANNKEMELVDSGVA